MTNPITAETDTGSNEMTAHNERTPGRKIIEGLEAAVAGDFARVTIGGQTWVRGDAHDALVEALELVKAHAFERKWDRDELVFQRVEAALALAKGGAES